MKIELTEMVVENADSIIYDIPRIMNFSTWKMVEAALYLIMTIPLSFYLLFKGVYIGALFFLAIGGLIYFLRFHMKSVYVKREYNFRRFRKIVGSFSAGNAVDMLHKRSVELKWKCIKRESKQLGIYITPLSLFSWGEKVIVKRYGDALLVCSMPRPDRPFSIIAWVHKSNIRQVLKVARNA